MKLVFNKNISVQEWLPIEKIFENGKLIYKSPSLKEIAKYAKEEQNTLWEEIKRLNKKLEKDKELKTLIEEYRKNNDNNLLKKIENNELFQEYKEKETNLNILILKINQRLKELTDKGRCSL